MAGDWIKMRSNLWDDPRVAKLCDLTDSGEAAVVGALYWLWAAADQHTEDGCMPGLTLRQIDRKTGLPGFAAAMVAIGWLVDNPQGVVICRFEEHNGTSAKRRCTDAQRKAGIRNVSASDADKERTGPGQDADEKRRSAELEKEKSNSVANATGPAVAAPPVDKSESQEDQAKRELYEAGKSLLQSRGMPKPQCGSFIGKLSKGYGQAVALEAVRAAVAAQPMDAAEYLKATCQRLKGERRDPVTVPSDDKRADDFFASMDQRAKEASKPPASVKALLRRVPA